MYKRHGEGIVMKAILEFDLNDDDDGLLYRQMSVARNMVNVILDIKGELRSIVKYGKEGMHLETAQKILDLVNESLGEENINMDSIG